MDAKPEENPKPPTADSLKEQGNAAIKNGSYEEAVLHYTHAIKIEARNFILYSNRSFAFLRLKQFALAMEDAQQTIALNPEWAKGYFRCGEVEFATEQYEEAQISYEMALKLKPGDQSIYECVEKAKCAKVRAQKKDAQFPWLGAGIGLVLGVIILLADFSLTKNPTHPLVMVFATMAISLIGYLIARGVQATCRSQKQSLIGRKALPTETDDDSLEDNEEDKNGKARSKYTKSQARQRYRKGKL